MKRTLIAAVAIVGTVGGATAQTRPVAQDIVVTNVWARATADAAKTGAAYMTITDNGRPDRLTGISTPVAGTAEVHQTINANGIVQMRAVADLPLETGKAITFAPGGYHVMLMNLKQPLKQGETFPMTLAFEHAKPVTVQVKVGGVGASGSMGSMSGMHDMPGMTTSGSHKP
jgi:periplasmic copper chaperone A